MSLRDSDIEKAVEVPIPEILDRLNVPYKVSGNHITMICPFHEEYEGSLTIFDDNKYTCFGCGEYGNGIHLIRKLLDLSFKDAVEFIILIGQGK